MEHTFLKVLVVEDSQEDAELLVRELRSGGYDPVYERVDRLEAMKTALEQKSWDLIVLDHSMPHFNAEAAYTLLKHREPSIPFILVSGTIEDDTGVEAMKAGAKDYIFKGNLKRLVPVVDRTMREIAEQNLLKSRIEMITTKLKGLVQQQEIVAVIGQLALSGTHPALLMNDVVYLVTQTLKADLGLFLEPLSDGRTLKLRAGFGWREGLVGRFELTTQEATEHGFALLSEEPTVFESLTEEDHIKPLPFFKDYGVMSGLSVSIWGQNRSLGVLGVYTKKRRKFAQEDVNFLQAVANILAAAMDHMNLESGLLKQSG